MARRRAKAHATAAAYAYATAVIVRAAQAQARSIAQATQVAQARANAQATQQAAAAIAAAAETAAAPVTLIDHQGSGQWTSDTFTAPGDWYISYSYDCANFGSSGNFQVDIAGGDQGFSTSGVNELNTSGSGTTAVHDDSGSGVYLSVNSECDWHVIAHT